MAPPMRDFVKASATRNMIISGVLGTIGAAYWAMTIYAPQKAEMAAFREWNKNKK